MHVLRTYTKHYKLRRQIKHIEKDGLEDEPPERSPRLSIGILWPSASPVKLAYCPQGHGNLKLLLNLIFIIFYFFVLLFLRA